MCFVIRRKLVENRCKHLTSEYETVYMFILYKYFRKTLLYVFSTCVYATSVILLHTLFDEFPILFTFFFLGFGPVPPSGSCTVWSSSFSITFSSVQLLSFTSCGLTNSFLFRHVLSLHKFMPSFFSWKKCYTIFANFLFSLPLNIHPSVQVKFYWTYPFVSPPRKDG